MMVRLWMIATVVVLGICCGVRGHGHAAMMDDGEPISCVDKDAYEAGGSKRWRIPDGAGRWRQCHCGNRDRLPNGEFNFVRICQPEGCEVTSWDNSTTVIHPGDKSNATCYCVPCKDGDRDPCHRLHAGLLFYLNCTVPHEPPFAGCIIPESNEKVKVNGYVYNMGGKNRWTCTAGPGFGSDDPYGYYYLTLDPEDTWVLNIETERLGETKAKLSLILYYYSDTHADQSGIITLGDTAGVHSAFNTKGNHSFHIQAGIRRLCYFTLTLHQLDNGKWDNWRGRARIEGYGQVIECPEMRDLRDDFSYIVCDHVVSDVATARNASIETPTRYPCSPYFGSKKDCPC